MKSLRIGPKPLIDVTSEEWARVSAGLRTYAKLRLSYVQNYGLSLDDIIQEALVLTLSGKRRWPVIDRETGETKRDLDLLTFLCGVARSVASHWIRKQRRTVSLTGLLDDGEDSKERTNSDRRRLVESLGESQDRARPENEIVQDEYRNALDSKTRTHPRLMKRARSMMRRRKLKLKEIARILGVDAKRARYLMNLLNGGNGNGEEEE